MTDPRPGSNELERHFEAANVALGRGDREAAADALRTAIREFEVRDDADGPLVAALTRLGEIELDSGREADAEVHFQRALGFGERQLGPEHPELAVLLNALSRLYLRRGAHDLAEPLLQRLYTIKRAKGEEHPEVATVLASLASLRQLVGRHDAAEQLWRRVLEIRERTLAPNHVATATALERLADTCAARAKGAEAVQLLQRALAMRELTLGSTHPSVRALRERIADVQLQAADDGDDAPLAPFVPRASAPVTRPSAGTAAAWRDSLASYSPPAPMPVIPAAPVVPAPASAPAPAPTATMAFAPMAGAYTPYSSEERAMERAPESATPVHSEPTPEGLRLQHMLAELASSEQRSKQVALVMPGANGAGESHLSLQSMLEQIEEELGDEATHLSLAERAAVLVREHRRPAMIAGGAMLLLGVAFTVALARGGDAEADASAQFVSPAAYTAPDPSLTQTASSVANASLGTPLVGGAGAAGATTSATTSATTDRAATSDTRAVTSRETERESSRSREPERRESAKESSRSAREETPRAPTLASVPALQIDAMTNALPNVKMEDPVASRLATFGTSKRTPDSARSASDRTQPARLLGAPPVARYPQSLRQTGVSGEVRVVFEVDTTGRPDMRTLVILKSSHELFSASVRNAIPEMRFVPAEIDGKKARWSVRMPFLFALNNAR